MNERLLSLLLLAVAGMAPPAAGGCAATAASGASSWVSLDPEAVVRPGQGGSVEYRYRVREGAAPLLSRTGLDLTGCAAVSFRVRSSHAGGLAFGLTESDESRYGTLTWLPAGAWSEVRLDLGELQLAEDSRDEDGTLVPGPGQSLFLLDVAAFSQTFDPAVRGERTLEVSDVSFSARAAGAAGSRPGKEGGLLVLDSFEAGILRWMPIAVEFQPQRLVLYPADVSLALEAGGPEAGAPTALLVRYPQKPMAAIVMSRDVAGIDLRRAEQVAFWIRSERPATFLASLEERAGARYEQAFPLETSRWTRVELEVAGFALAQDSRDSNRRLDLDAVKLFSIVAARLEEGTVVPNTIALDQPGFRVRPDPTP